MLSHGQEVVEADQISTRAFVVAALALEVVEAIGLQCRRDDRQQGRLDTDLLHADVIGSKQRVVEALARQPGADRSGLRCLKRRLFGRLVCRGFSHDSTVSAAGASTAASVARVWPAGAAARAAFCVSALR